MVNICYNVRFAHGSLPTVRRNDDRIRERAKSRNKVFVWQDCHSPVGIESTKTIDVRLLRIYCIINK